jgi:hypothetical protein
MVVAFRAAATASAAGDDSPAGPAGRLAAWVVPLAALTVGLLPEASLRALFGVG